MNKQEIEKALEWTNAYLEYEKHTKATYEDTCGTGDMSEDERKEIYEAMDSNISLFVTITEVLEQQLTNGWIPVSERLPEETGEYQCTVEWYGTSTKKRLIESNHIIEKRVINVYFLESISAFKEQDGFCAYEVIAWQPLPKPYKEVSE